MKIIKRGAPLAALAFAVWLFRSRSRSAGQQRYVKVVFQPIGSWAARRTLVGRNRSQHAPQLGRFTRADVKGLLANAWRRYDAQAPDLPTQPTAGSRMNIRLACLTLSLFRALLDRGVERAYAVELTADVAWKVYENWGRLAEIRSRMRPTTETALAARVRHDGTVGLSFPFNAPGYVAKHVPGGEGLAFDMVRCAVADYCLVAWCNLDYALGEMGGLVLQRTRTLVEGAESCDFRWTIASATASAAENRPPSASVAPKAAPIVRQVRRNSTSGAA